MKSASPLTTPSWTVTRSFLAALWMFDFQEAPVSVLWPWAKNYSALTWATHEESLLSTKKTKLWRRRSAETKSQVKTTRQHASSTAVEGLIHSVTLIRTQLAHFAFGWKLKISQDLPWQGLSATKSPRGSVLLLSQVSKVKQHFVTVSNFVRRDTGTRSLQGGSIHCDCKRWCLGVHFKWRNRQDCQAVLWREERRKSRWSSR